MNLKKPKFWDYKKPNIIAYLLLPIAFLIQIFVFLFRKTNAQKLIKFAIFNTKILPNCFY